MTNPRESVWRLLAQWQQPAFPPLLPDRAPTAPAAPHSPAADFAALPPRDRAFGYDLLTGVLRWRALLDAVIASRLTQPLDSLDLPVKALLWLGAYQLLLQSGTADYAAVDTTVELARKHKATAKAGGLVNAILRNITRLHPKQAPLSPGPTLAHLARTAFAIDFTTQVTLDQPIFPDPITALTPHLAAVRSHPSIYVDHLRATYGDAPAADLLLRNNLRPAITLRADSAALDVPVTAGLVAHATAKQMLAAAEGWNPDLERLVAKGTLSPQDPTSARPVRRAAELVAENKLPAPKRILDLCAGLGTKSIQLARAFPNATITASDIDEDKLQKLATRAKQLKLTNIEILNAAALASAPPFDLILADVPCSNTGVMAKRVQSRWRWPTLDRPALHALQQSLMDQAQKLLAKNGTLIYATCSIDPDENQKLIAQWQKTAPLSLKEETVTLPSLAEPAAGTHDGGYFAVLT